MLGRIENALADQAAVGARHARFFLVLAAGNHQPCSDLQLAEHVALLVAFHGHAGIGLVFVERIGVQRLYRLGVSTAPGVGERSQTDARARRELHPMHGEAQPCREVAEQAEAVARLDDEQARPVDRRHRFRMLLSVALLPEPVGPNRNRCAFICRSRRFNGSKVIGPPPRLKNVMPGCPVP